MANQNVEQEIDTEHEEAEFMEASEAYSEAVAEKERWADEAKARLKTMRARHADLMEAREGKTSLSQFAEG